MPCLPPAETCTRTRVVRSHSRVPSASGKSVGTTKVLTARRSMGTTCECPGMLNDDETYALSSVDNGPKRVTFILMFHRWRGIASVQRDKTSCCDTQENMLLVAGITTKG